MQEGQETPPQDQTQIQVGVWLPQKGGTRMLKRDSFPRSGHKGLTKD